MTDVFEQVEEELRSERYKRLARTWGPVVGGVLVLALIAALAFWGWDSLQTRQAGAASESYNTGLEALQSGDLAAAETAFAEAEERGNGAYKALALNQRAGIAVQNERIEDAVRLFDEAASASRDPILADMARLKAAYLVMDTAPLEQLVDRLEPLGEDDRPFAPYAQEALALSRLQHGEAQAAREMFVLLSLGQDVPESVRARSQAAIQMIDSDTASALPAIVAAARQLETQPEGEAQAPASEGQAPAAEAPAQP